MVVGGGGGGGGGDSYGLVVLEVNHKISPQLVAQGIRDSFLVN